MIHEISEGIKNRGMYEELPEANAFKLFESTGHSTLWIACIAADVIPLMTPASSDNAQKISLLLGEWAKNDGKAYRGVTAPKLPARYIHCHIVLKCCFRQGHRKIRAIIMKKKSLIVAA